MKRSAQKAMFARLRGEYRRDMRKWNTYFAKHPKLVKNLVKAERAGSYIVMGAGYGALFTPAAALAPAMFGTGASGLVIAKETEREMKEARKKYHLTKRSK